jgi:hypothetical protein
MLVIMMPLFVTGVLLTLFAHSRTHKSLLFLAANKTNCFDLYLRRYLKDDL